MAGSEDSGRRRFRAGQTNRRIGLYWLQHQLAALRGDKVVDVDGVGGELHLPSAGADLATLIDDRALGLGGVDRDGLVDVLPQEISVGIAQLHRAAQSELA